VQVALDPHPARALVGPRVLVLRHVRVEQARAAPVERERRRRHLAELPAERHRVRAHQLVERGHQHLDDLFLPCLLALLGDAVDDVIHVPTMPPTGATR
jgi:hypothetical protein